jgi:hypothetical protein
MSSLRSPGQFTHTAPLAAVGTIIAPKRDRTSVLELTCSAEAPGVSPLLP